MTPDMWVALAILAMAIVLFVTEWIRLDVVALGVVILLILTNVLSVDQALAGFSSSAVILIVALFIVGGAVFQTGLAGTIGDQILRVAGSSENRLVIVVTLAVAGLSAFISNTGTVALLLPAILSVAAVAKISASRLLIPLAFASSFGGAATLIGTPPNIIASEALRDAGFSQLDFFAFTPAAVVLLLAGVIFMTTIGKRLLPDRRPTDEEPQVVSPEELLENYKLPESIYKVRIRKASPIVGKQLSDVHLSTTFGLNVLEISRPAPAQTLVEFGGQQIVMQSKKNRNIPIHPRMDTELHRDDILILQGDASAVSNAAARLTLAIQPKAADETESIISNEVGVAEVVLPSRSALIGKTLVDLRFGTNYKLTVMNIKRPGQDEPIDLRNTSLRFGDTLLVQGEWRDILALRKYSRDFILIGETEVARHVLNWQKAPIALAVLFGMMVLLVTGWVPTVAAALIAAMTVVLTGCLTMDEAYDSIDWKSVVLIAGMIPMSTALEQVGLVDVVANLFTDTLGAVGPLAVMAGLYLLTSVFTQVLSNTATTVLLAPIAIAAALNLGVAPQAFVMSVAVSASMAFASPVASPVNTLVMGAGNYRFSDYIRIGVPLILVTFVISMVILPLLFPL
jgi:di/tricarboxylate transporter